MREKTETARINSINFPKITMATSRRRNLQTFLTFAMFLCLTSLMSSCREDYIIIAPENERVDSAQTVDNTTGFYLLNEGNMGTNKATLDFYDFATGTYTRNIYGNANPSIPMQLGDVGNDLQIHGSRMYAVINCSNKIEVMDKTTARHIGQIDIANCRYIRFHGQFAYVTSYAGPVSINPNYEQRGYVAKIDTATMQVVDTCLVGYQPDELAIADGKIYVANSGGYMTPNYERELSVIDLATFRETHRIPVAINLHRVRPDSHHQLWVSSRGDYRTASPKLYCVDSRKDIVTDSIDIPVGDCWLDSDSLYICGKQYNELTHKQETSYAIVNVKTHKVATRHFITDGSEERIETPYSVFVHPKTKDIYVTDAKGYITPGVLHCFSNDGKHKWEVATGDIPAHAAFTTTMPHGNDDGTTDDRQHSPYISKVFEYCPAPGQFINQYPKYETGDNAESMCTKAATFITGTANSPLSLGGFGGYVVFGFDHKISNIKGKMDFEVLGNAFISDRQTTRPGGSSEPGIIMVSEDVNGNGLPDDPWYEIAGSEHGKSATTTNYAITYHQSDGDVRWSDNQGNTGFILRNEYHTQESYFPMWLGDSTLTFTGTRLADNYADESGNGSYYVQYCYDYGYADNQPNGSLGSKINIEWAVDGNGKPANLSGIHFVKIYSGTNQDCGWLGESSTEVAGAIDLHLNGEDVDDTTAWPSARTKNTK